jgi:hypothetical protein
MTTPQSRFYSGLQSAATGVNERTFRLLSESHLYVAEHASEFLARIGVANASECEVFSLQLTYDELKAGHNDVHIWLFSPSYLVAVDATSGLNARLTFHAIADLGIVEITTNNLDSSRGEETEGLDLKVVLLNRSNENRLEFAAAGANAAHLQALVKRYLSRPASPKTV